MQGTLNGGNNENNICEEITYERCKTVITGIRNKDNSVYSAGLPANLKYYKTSFIPKISDGMVSNKLLKSIKELIKLEHHCEIDNKTICVAFEDEQLDEIIKNNLSECKKIFISSEVFLTGEQEKILENNGIETIDIPEYYFAEELREVDEL